MRPIYTCADIPPPLECEKCNKKTPYLSYYIEKAYCDNCLEDELNKTNGFGNIVEGTIKTHSPIEEGTCERCEKYTLLDHEWTDGKQRHLICSKCTEEMKESVESQKEGEVPEVQRRISKDPDVEYVNMGGNP